MGSKKKEILDHPLKRAVILDPIVAAQNRYIELPEFKNQGDLRSQRSSLRFYGENIYLRLVDHMHKSGDFAVLLGTESPRVTQPEVGVTSSALLGLFRSADPDPCLFSPELTEPKASSRIKIKINELSFAVGTRANRSVYGFMQGAEHVYNSGEDLSRLNDFHGPSFDLEHDAESRGLRTGLELANDFNLDVLLLGSRLKQTEYYASMGVEIEFQNSFGKNELKKIKTTGSGFYFDWSGHALTQIGDISIGVSFARNLALKDAFDRLIEKTVESISNSIAQIPLFTTDLGLCSQTHYIAVGSNMRVKKGQQFMSRLYPIVYEVTEVFQRISSVKIVSGHEYLSQAGPRQELMSVPLGQSFVHLGSSNLDRSGTERLSVSQSALSSTHELNQSDRPLIETTQVQSLEKKNYELPSQMDGFLEGYFVRLWEGVKSLVTLPYRLYRWHQYDQSYSGGEIWRVDLNRARQLVQNNWGLQTIGAYEAWQNQGRLGDNQVVVAVIDTGVDYNHPELRRNIYFDGRYNLAGWDFYSADSRAYDDHAHGTEVASVIAGGGAKILGVAPWTTILPIKAFGPYGHTTSSAIYSSFDFAVKMGAKIIVTAWNTKIYSRALYDALDLARKADVLVVSAAGDQGQDLDINPQYPASFGKAFSKNQIVVTGITKQKILTWKNSAFSNFGKNTVEIAAPGSEIMVATPRGSYEQRSHSGLAAAMVAGAAAFLKAQCPKLGAFELKKALLDGAINLPTLSGQVADNKALSLIQSSTILNEVCK